MLKISVSRKSDNTAEEIFNRINTIDKLSRYEKEFEEVSLEYQDKEKGVAAIRVKIFGKEIKGKMDYKIEKGRITATVNSRDIKYLKFGYFVDEVNNGSHTTQFVEFDTGSLIKNLFVKIFFSGKIKRHMEEEVLRVIK